MNKLWRDDRAFILSAELTLIATIMVVGMVVGLVAVRDHVVQELGDVAAAIGNLSQAYSYSGLSGHSAASAGTSFIDQRDYCDDSDNTGPGSSNGPSNGPSNGDFVAIYGVLPTPEGVVSPRSTIRVGDSRARQEGEIAYQE